MVRPAATDFFQNNRFHVFAGSSGRLDRVGGFRSADMPDISAPAVEYREGIYTWTRKYPGIPEVGQLTLERGVIKRRTSFFDWLRDVIIGGADYREDLTVTQFHRTDEFGSVDVAGSRSTIMREAFPTSVTPTSALAADDAEVTIETIVFDIEQLEITEIDAEATA